jgi:multidrug resistance efflux pump
MHLFRRHPNPAADLESQVQTLTAALTQANAMLRGRDADVERLQRENADLIRIAMDRVVRLTQRRMTQQGRDACGRFVDRLPAA